MGITKDQDYPDIYYNGKLVITAREMRIESIRRRRRFGWCPRVLPKRMGVAVAKGFDNIFLEAFSVKVPNENN